MAAKLRLVFTITILFASFWSYSQDNYWTSGVRAEKASKDFIKESNFSKSKLFSADEKMLKERLIGLSASKNNKVKIYFPDENGEIKAFYIQEAPVLAPELAAKYPQIKSYKGYGVDDAKNKIRFSLSHNGLQVMMVHPDKAKATFIQKTAKNNYTVYARNGLSNKEDDFVCKTSGSISESKSASTLRPVDDRVLRKYRLAVSASGEYTAFHGGTVADALAAINATVTRVNQLFETDLSMTLELVANNDEVIYTDAASDPYTDNLNAEVQSALTGAIGEANYDIGHLFHLDTNNGNAGFIGAICNDGQKGSAYSSGITPEGDKYDIDFVAHEIGHQLGANHTWSFESEGTGVQMEPGSGSTIMGYAGITGENNVTGNSDDYFHVISIVQILNTLRAKTCGEQISLTNNPPVVNPLPDYIIPSGTAFALTGSATDSDGDDLSYTWEQVDNGVVTRDSFGPENFSGANFRSRKPSSDPTRYFPQLQNIRNGNLTLTNPTIATGWETVSTVARQFNFAFTVRDNATSGGQVVTEVLQVSVQDSGSPFTVDSQTAGTSYTAGEVQEINWTVAGTDQSPFNTPLVDIFLSVDDGLTFPIVLAEDVVNDGVHQVLIPGVATEDARVMVRSSSNIFFAMNDASFTILESAIVLNPSQLNVEVCQPDDAVLDFVYETYGGFSEQVTFEATGLPAGLTASFTPATATADGTNVVLTLSGSQNLNQEIYDFTIQAVGASETKEIGLGLAVKGSEFPEVVKISPIDAATDVSTTQFFEWETNPLYTSYDIEIASDAGFGTVVETGLAYGNTYRATNLDNATSYFWRIRPRNLCGAGSFGAANSFTTIVESCTTRTGADLPIPISPNGSATITSSIEFFDDAALTGLTVDIDLDHTYLADLEIRLTAPSGKTVILVSRSCGNLQNMNATFDDTADAFVCDGDPGISGTVSPLGSLASLYGESIAGVWILAVEDTENNDGGALNSFRLNVCAEGVFQPDDDGDGVFNENDLCPNTSPGLQVDATGCPVYRFEQSNFQIKVTSESCRSANDGFFEINTLESLDYSVTVSGNGVNVSDTFTTAFTQNNLSAGVYTVCFDAVDGDKDYEELCFEVSISEPEALSVSSKLGTDSNSLELNLEGSDVYTISLNGEDMLTTKSQVTLDLKPGNNLVKVTGSLECQGAYEEQFFVASGIIIYPNPSTNYVRLFVEKAAVIQTSLFAIDGRLIRSEKRTTNSSEAEIDVSDLSAGTYILKVESEFQNGTYKIIKR